MVCTEIATLPLISGSDIEDQNSPAGRVWREMYNTLQGQTGYQQASYGRGVESPNVVLLFVNWDSLKHHQDFMASTDYAPFFNNLKGILDPDNPPSITHYEFASPGTLSQALGAPATELAMFYFDNKSDQFESGLQPVAEAFDKHAEGFIAVDHAWSIEKVKHQGNELTQCLVLVGWQSVEAHQKFAQTDTLKSIFKDLAQQTKGTDMYHVIMKSF